jgi:DNA-binding response OmpR family regulator
MRLLVAEDDTGLRSVLARGLREHGFVVDCVDNGDDALTYLRSYEYEVVVLDWRMPGRSGLEVVGEARRGGIRTPILMLTARDAPADRISGLDEGADDYLIKPFDFSELLARLRALQRRPALALHPVLSCGDVTLDPATREVTSGGQQLVLTATEMAILEVLLRRSPAVVYRRAIALAVWDDEADAVGSNTIDVHVARLRAKLGTAGALIETTRGIGYRIAAS